MKTMKDQRAKRPSRCQKIVLAAIFLSSLIPLLKAENEILTMESAVQMALARNERALSADQSVRAVEARVTRARSYFLPQLNATGVYTRRPFEVVRQMGDQRIVVQNYNALSGVAALNMTLFDSRSIPALLQAKADRKAEIYASAEAKRQLAFEVSNAFLTTLGTEQMLEAANHRFEFARQALAAARARYAAGLVSTNDVTRAELEYANAEMGITQVKGQVETTYLQLGYLLDDEQIIQKELQAPDFLIQAAQEEEPPAIEQLISQAQERRLDLNSLRWRSKSQQALLIEPTLKWLPTLSLNAQYRYTNEAGLTGRNFNWNAGMTLTWAIFDGFSRNADHKERSAWVEIADLDVQSSLRGVELDVRDALVSLDNQRAALKQAQVAYEVARRNAREVAELYRQGLTSVLQVADANVQLFEAEVDLVRARYSLGSAYLNLEAAQGLDPFGKEPIR
jgi:outer membrane protein TolC